MRHRRSAFVARDESRSLDRMTATFRTLCYQGVFSSPGVAIAGRSPGFINGGNVFFAGISEPGCGASGNVCAGVIVPMFVGGFRSRSPKRAVNTPTSHLRDSVAAIGLDRDADLH